jgi:hypothetical protein
MGWGSMVGINVIHWAAPFPTVLSSSMKRTESSQNQHKRMLPILNPSPIK